MSFLRIIRRQSNNDTNGTDVTIASMAYACHSPESVLTGNVLVVIFTLAFTLGAIGNLSALLVIGCPKTNKGSLRMYVQSLAARDLLSALSLLIWAIDAHSSWIFGDAICKVAKVLSEQAVYAGVLLLLGMCVHSVGVTRSCLPCVCAWLFGTLLAFTSVLFHGVSQLSTGVHVCHSRRARTLWFPFTLLRNGVGAAVPALLSLFMTAAYYRLRNAELKSKKKKALVMSLTLAFTMLQSPHCVCSLIKTLLSSRTIKGTCQLLQSVETAASITQVISMCHCVINPVFYALFWSLISA